MNLQGKVRSLLLLEPRGGDYDAMIDVFRTHDILGKAIHLAGAWSAEVHLPLSRSGPVVVTALWDSEAAYAGWRTHPIRASSSDRVRESFTLPNTRVRREKVRS